MILNESESRLDGYSKVTGSARFAADLHAEGCLFAEFVRSPVPHALIRHVDTSEASRMPGVALVLTGEDTKPARLGRRLQDWPVLAWDRVRMVGDRVAVVAAATNEIAAAAAAAVVVEYEELPAILDVEAAIAPGASVLHPDAASYSYLSSNARGSTSHPNIQAEKAHEHGDVEGGFSASARVFEHTFELTRTLAGYLEPRASTVWVTDGVIHVSSTNKSPFRLRDQMSVALNLPAERIVIHSPHIGGDFGAKGFSMEEHALALLAQRLDRPIRTVTSFLVDATTFSTRHGGTVTLRTGVDEQGRICAHEASIVFDGGAYAAPKPQEDLAPDGALQTLAGYRIPAARIRARYVYTNSIPGGQVRAPVQPQICFAAESHMDVIAREMRIDPIDFRRRNALTNGTLDVSGTTASGSRVGDVLDAVESLRGRPEKRPVGKGQGISLFLRGTPSGTATVELRVSSDGTVELATSVADQGAGAHTMLQRVVAAVLGIPTDCVTVRGADTSNVSYDQGVGGSRITPVVGAAAENAAAQLLETLSHKYRGCGSSLERLAAAGRDEVVSVGTVERTLDARTHGAYLVDVEVDLETGVVIVERCVLVVDSGPFINPVAARGQLVGGMAFGLGQALMEEVIIDEGRVQTATLAEYKIPTHLDLPDLEVVSLPSEPGPGPFGAKSVGELSNSGVAPAIANAVHDAIGVRVFRLPIKGEALYWSMRKTERQVEEI